MTALISAGLSAAMSLAGISVPAVEPGTQLSLQQPVGRAPAVSVASAIAASGTPVVVWLEANRRRRVVGAVGSADAVDLGPLSAGIDGLPAASAAADGSVWVVAARFDGTTQRLWAQRWSNDSWQGPIPGPIGRPRNHHPAIAADPRSAAIWVVWVGDEGTGSAGAYLFSSRWTGTGWTPAETLPRTVGTPMAPALAVDAAGHPVVAWAAGNGDDAEIWISRRDNSGWSAATPLTDNLVPDIMPSIAIADGPWVVSWIGYSDAGYLPRVRLGASLDSWEDAVTLSSTPGGRPLAAHVAGVPAVFWRQLDSSPAGGRIRGSALDPSGWQDPVDLVPATGAPFDVSSMSNGRLTLSWTRADGSLGHIDSGSRGATTVRGALVNLSSIGAAAAGPGTTADVAGAVPTPNDSPADSTGIPRRYTAFGDSITNGVVQDPGRRTTQGYRKRLQRLLRGFFGFGKVLNAGFDGETTAEGTGRIDNVVRDQNPDALVLMEGTNDITFNIDRETIAFNLRQILQRADEEKPGIILFLALVIPRNDPNSGFEGSGNRRTDELNAMLPSVAKKEGATLVDQHAPMDNKPKLFSDHVHPSVEGYDVMGETWFAGVKPVAAAGSNRGDLDGSGRVDIGDLVRLALAFGARTGDDRFDSAADINGDGIVDGFDLNILSEFFGLEVAAS